MTSHLKSKRISACICKISTNYHIITCYNKGGTWAPASGYIKYQYPLTHVPSHGAHGIFHLFSLIWEP